MAKATILKTNIGIMVMGSIQCSNGAWFDAEGCYKYCNEEEKSDIFCKLQSDKLIYNSTLLSREPEAPDDWYKHRENFIDIEIAFECNQSYNFKDSKNKY